MGPADDTDASAGGGGGQPGEICVGHANGTVALFSLNELVEAEEAAKFGSDPAVVTYQANEVVEPFAETSPAPVTALCFVDGGRWLVAAASTGAVAVTSREEDAEVDVELIVEGVPEQSHCIVDCLAASPLMPSLWLWADTRGTIGVWSRTDDDTEWQELERIKTTHGASGSQMTPLSSRSNCRATFSSRQVGPVVKEEGAADWFLLVARARDLASP